MKIPSKTSGREAPAWERLIRKRIEKFNAWVNAIPPGKKKIMLATAGTLIAVSCGTIVRNAIVSETPAPTYMEKITQPNDIFMRQTDTTTLTPLGKMKGEINGTFEAFYLAVDRKGQPYLHRNPPYDESRYDKTQGWQPITREQLAAYEKSLHFIPHRKQSLTP